MKYTFFWNIFDYMLIPTTYLFGIKDNYLFNRWCRYIFIELLW